MPYLFLQIRCAVDTLNVLIPRPTEFLVFWTVNRTKPDFRKSYIRLNVTVIVKNATKQTINGENIWQINENSH